MISPESVSVTIKATKLVMDLCNLIISKDSSRVVKGASDRFLNYDPGEVRRFYASERPVQPALTYVLACDLIGIDDPRSGPVAESVQLEHYPQPYVQSVGQESWSRTVAAGYQALIDSGRVKEDETLVRVADFEIQDKKLILKCHQAKYHDQARSNLILDFYRNDHPMYTSLRSQLYEDYCTRLPNLADTRMANTLGVALLIFYKSGGSWVPYFIRRVKKIGVFPGGIHCSSSGAVRWANGDAEMNFAMVTNHMLDEAQEEIGVLPNELIDLKPVAFCREMVRGGKPQLFYCARTHLSRKELAERRQYAVRVAREQKLWTELEIDRWFRSADVVMTSSRIRHGLETWGITQEGAAALYFGSQYIKKFL